MTRLPANPTGGSGARRFYAAATAARLGARAVLATRIGPDEGPRLLRRCADFGITVHARAASQSTAFDIAYQGGRRSLRLVARAEPLGRVDVPEQWRRASCAVLAPVTDEIAPELLDALDPSVLVIVAQGWLRGWGRDGVAAPKRWEGAQALVERAAATVVSAEDLRSERDAEAWAAHGPVIVTRGAAGARLYADGKAADVAGFRAARVVDPTGAGDVFAAALALALARGLAMLDGVREANAVASFAVEADGIGGLADRAAVDARLAAPGISP